MVTPEFLCLTHDGAAAAEGDRLCPARTGSSYCLQLARTKRRTSLDFRKRILIVSPVGERQVGTIELKPLISTAAEWPATPGDGGALVVDPACIREDAVACGAKKVAENNATSGSACRPTEPHCRQRDCQRECTWI